MGFTQYPPATLPTFTAANANPGTSVAITAGNALSSNNAGGSITLTPGTKSGSGAAGQIILANLPTSDPSIAGALYVTAGAVKISAG